MIQKIIKVGNSAAVTIPKDFMKKTGLSIGDEISMESDTIAKMIVVKSKNQEGKNQLTPEFFQWLDRISKKYESTIKELATR